MSTSYINEIEKHDEDEIEELIAIAKKESLRHFNEVELPRQQKNEPTKHILSTQVGGEPGTFLYEGIEAKGFHLSAGSSYIYPTNYPVRQYQASIVKAALFKNTLVSLPTGLGKTFIAAVVMYNFYRWYPSGKIVFMAPTRPLVAQQTKACHHIMNIPQDDTTEMTGVQSAEQRTALWKSKRVFYLTPQVMVNDLKMKTCPASLIKCVVIDEAHRATKEYAYCQVLKILSETDAVFRILALSATPGNDIAAVQQVIKNLQIEALEMRSEESLDVIPYVHSRDVNPIIVELSGNIQRVKNDLLQVFEKYAKKLKDFKALTMNISNINKFQVLKACEKFRANPPRGVPPAMIGGLVSDFTVCMSLAHSLELLQIYGLRAFYSYLTDDSGEKTKAATTRLRNDEDLKEILKRLQGCLYPKNDKFPYTWSHPKLQNLVKVLSDHFQNAEDQKSTKAIVFCQFRVVVTEIVELLNKNKPLIKATEFVGQSGGKDKGMPQAKQLQIMKDFRSGLINCLVATCVAEEGLDIGEVDLIVLMEAHKSPVRLVQRLGRTGRKRKGCCIVLLTKGKEEQKFKEAMATRKSYVQNIVNAPAVKASLCQDTPRMIPNECKPVQQLVHIHASNFESPARPGTKKQTDIRRLLTAQAPGPACSSDEDLSKALEELGSTKLTFNKIPERRELWHKQHGDKISMEDLFSSNINGFSEWNEWNMDEHETFYIGHTSQTKLLCHLLKTSNKEISLPKYNLVPGLDLENNLQEVTIKKPVISPKDNAKKTKKKDVKKNMGMDIRSCMNLITEQNISDENEIIEILSDNSQDLLSIIPLPKKAKICLSPKPFINDDSKSCSFYEENNDLCRYLNKYMLPKKIKKKFNFQKTLPDLDNILSYVTHDILINFNFKIINDKNIDKIVNSPIIGCTNSPLSSTIFDIDDLFCEEMTSPKVDVIVNQETSELSYSLGKGLGDSDMILDINKDKITLKNNNIKKSEIVKHKFNQIETVKLEDKININDHTTNKVKSVDVELFENFTADKVLENYSIKKAESKSVMPFQNQSLENVESNRVVPSQKQSIEKVEPNKVIPFQQQSESVESKGAMAFQKQSSKKVENSYDKKGSQNAQFQEHFKDSQVFDICDVLSENMHDVPDWSFCDNNKEIQCLNKLNENMTSTTNGLKTITSSFINIQNNKNKKLMSFQKQLSERVGPKDDMLLQMQLTEEVEVKRVTPFQNHLIEKVESTGLLPLPKQLTETVESNEVKPSQKQSKDKYEIPLIAESNKAIGFSDHSTHKSIWQVSKGSQSFNIDDVLNGNINPDQNSNFGNDDEKILCKTKFKGNVTPAAKGHKTLTSSFINIHNNNLKMFNSVKNKSILQKDSNSVNRNIASQKCSKNIEFNKEVLKVDHLFYDDDDDEFHNIEEGIVNQKALQFHSTPLKARLNTDNVERETEIICSPSSMKEFAAPSKMTCSTPLVTVKKFKKNLLMVDNKLSNSETKCNQPVVNKCQEESKYLSKSKNKSPSPIDVWNLSDLLEVDDESNTQMKPQDSTMFGITQMVSLIEQEKNKNNDIELLENKIVSTTENNPTSQKAADLSAFLDGDADIFCELNIDTNDKIEEDISLSQKYISDELKKKQTEISQGVERNKIKKDFIDQILDDKDTETDLELKILLNAAESHDCLGNNSEEYGDISLTQKHDFIESNNDPDMPVNETTTDLSHWSLEHESNKSKPHLDLIDFTVLNKDKNLKNIDTENDVNKIAEESYNNEITLVDMDEYNNFEDMLTQKYVIEEDDCRVESLNLKTQNLQPSSTESETLLNELNTILDSESCSTENGNIFNKPNAISTVTIKQDPNYTNDAITSHTELLNSEPSQTSQKSQTVNFKKFNKKLPIETASKEASCSNTQNQVHSTIQTSNSNSNFFSQKPEINTAASNSIIHTEKKISTTNNEMNKLTTKNSSESKVRIDLFQTKKSTKNIHMLSDDSDDDVFKLPTSKNIPDERHHIKRPRNELFTPLLKVESAKPLAEKNNSNKAVIPSKIIPREHKPSKKTKKLKNHNGLIEIEADVSGEYSSDDSDGSSLDDLDNSFINDDTECFTQTMYLKSVKSPIGQGKYKIPQNKKYTSNVYSQHIVEEDSEYINDSFCVDSEEEIDESNNRSLSLLEIAEEELKNNKKEILTTKRHRILNMTTSEESSTEKKRPSPSEPTLRPGAARKRRRLLSDSESDTSPLAKHKSVPSQSVVPTIPSLKTSSPLLMKKNHFVDLTNSSSEDETVSPIKQDRHFASLKNSVVNKLDSVVKNKSGKRKSKLDEKILKLNSNFAKKLENIKQKYFGSDDSSD